MVRVGFDVKRYNPKPEWKAATNKLAHDYISILQGDIYRAQQRRVNVSQLTLGFIEVDRDSAIHSNSNLSDNSNIL